MLSRSYLPLVYRSCHPGWLARPRSFRWRAQALVALLLLSLVATDAGRTLAAESDPAPSRNGGPWYTDLRGHWAETYVRVLWQEGVTTPPLGVGGDPTDEVWTRPGRYGPDSGALPCVFGVMLARLFPGGPFPPPPVALALVQGCRTQSPEQAGVWRSVQPSFSRLDAVKTLLFALGLGGFAENLSPQTAATYLGRFEDWRAVPPDARQAMAVAILLRIINGYPDGTLRPLRPLSRAEGATILYRSCLLLAEARPNPFSPDGDGAEDQTVISLGSLLNRNSQAWDFSILDARGRVLRHLRTPNPGPSPPSALVWDGKTDAGLVLTPGLYYYQGFLKDRNGLVHWSALKPISLEEKALRGFARPSLVLPGETVVLWAVAAGGPSSVTATLSSFPSAGTLSLSPVRNGTGGGDGPPRTWETTFRIPDNAGAGPCLATFTARYPSSTRTATAAFEVDRLAVRGELRPNPVLAGGVLEILAWPNLEPDRVQASVDLPHRPLAVSLSPTGATPSHTTWRAETVIAPDTPPGAYEVTLTAWRGQQEATWVMSLEVIRGQADLTFILSD